MRKPFTKEEKDLLTSDGWEVAEAVAYKNYHKLIKLQDEEIEIETLVTDEPDGNDYWEWDSTSPSVEKAVRYCNKRS